MKWAIITGEYSPQPGGVSDYTRILSEALAATGDEVHVWAPFCPESGESSDVYVHRLAGKFGFSGLRQLRKDLDALPGPYRILVQYVPHAYGWKAMNVPFCLWLWSRRRTPVWVMFHEVAFPFAWSQAMRRNVLAGVTRLMASLVIRAAQKVFISTPAWEPVIRSLGPRNKPLTWLPVPSTIGNERDYQRVQEIRTNLTGTAGKLIGHFGTYEPHNCTMLKAIVPPLLKRDECRHFLLMGRGSGAFAHCLAKEEPTLQSRVHVADGLSAREMSAHLTACELVAQPYPDGISTRRTSSMAALACGVPIVTNEGRLSEPLWREAGAVQLAENGSPEAFICAAEELLQNSSQNQELLRRAGALYNSRFAIEHTVDQLRTLAAA